MIEYTFRRLEVVVRDLESWFERLGRREKWPRRFKISPLALITI